MASEILHGVPQYPTFQFEAIGTITLSADPVICPACWKPHTIFVNQERRTVCAACDRRGEFRLQRGKQ